MWDTGMGPDPEEDSIGYNRARKRDTCACKAGPGKLPLRGIYSRTVQGTMTSIAHVSCFPSIV